MAADRAEATNLIEKYKAEAEAEVTASYAKELFGFIIGSTTPSHAFAAIAASTAVPPALSMSRAHMVESMTDVAAMPC